VHAHCRALAATTNRQSWEIRTPGATYLRLPVFGFPAWQATIGGKPSRITRDSETGLIGIKVPAGTHVVMISWGRLPVEKAGLAISFATILGLALLAWRRRRASEASLGSPVRIAERLDQEKMIC
jgi:uncharacterized membrane protein YfhO